MELRVVEPSSHHECFPINNFNIILRLTNFLSTMDNKLHIFLIKIFSSNMTINVEFKNVSPTAPPKGPMGA